MPDVIFLVHGMGKFTDGWEAPIVKQLTDFCDANSGPGKSDFGKRFKIIPINYSQLFLDILKTWAQEKKDVEGLSQQLGADLVQKLMSWIADDGSIDTNFFWSHAFDVVVYRLLPTVRDAVQVRVALQLYAGIQDLDVDDTWSILAHSLGTSVIHDTLQTWYLQPLAGDGTLGNHKTPYLVQMIANVSRILQNQYDVFTSDVKPGKACEFYYTAFHPLDPFTILRPFLPTAWPDSQYAANYYVAKLPHDYIQQADIHDLGHYLRHPDVVIPLLRCLTYATYVTKSSEAQYRQQFNPHGNLADPELVALRQRFEDAGVGLPDSWLAVLTVWNRVKDLMQLLTGGSSDTAVANKPAGGKAGGANGS